MYYISKIWSNLFLFGPAIASSNFDEVQKIAKFKNFYGKFLIVYQRRIPPKKFWILKFFGLRQNLTRQLPAQIKKGCSKFWICHTFKNCLNCGTISIFKKLWADDVLIFFYFNLDPFLRGNFRNLDFFSSKSLLIQPSTIFSHMKFQILKKNPDASNF